MKFLVLLFIVFPIANSFAQNLLINGSFNDANICDEYNAKCSPAGWFHVSNNPKGFIGNHDFLAIVAANSLQEGRDYWQTKLSCKTVVGEKYKISLEVSAPTAGPNLNDIGVYLTDTFLQAYEDTIIQPTNYISFLDATYKNRRKGWFQIEKEFTAEEANQFIIIGNFSSRSNREIIVKRRSKRISIFVDNVNLVPLNPVTCTGGEEVKQSLYEITKRHTYQINEQEVANSITKKDTTERFNVIDTIVINNVHFEFDSHRLIDTTDLKSLERAFAKNDLQKIKVVGFTDDVGDEKYNLELSSKRALEVSSILKKLYNLSDLLLEAEGRGISRQYTNKSLNRRVEIYLYHTRN